MTKSLCAPDDYNTETGVHRLFDHLVYALLYALHAGDCSHRCMYHTAYTAVFLRMNIISFKVFGIIIDIQTGLLPIVSYLNWECQVRDRTTSVVCAVKWDKSGM